VVLVAKTSRYVATAALAMGLTACGAPAATPVTQVTRTVTASPASQTPTPTPASDPGDPPSASPSAVADVADFPAELVGTWQSVDQGTAEDLIEIHDDGTYLRAMVMVQQRPSGMFQYSVGTKGHVAIVGNLLRLAPSSGTESLDDPDAPGDSYTDRPVDDLTPEGYRWSVEAGSLWLKGQYGLVEFRPAT
jgi:hypothetical protein